MKKLLLGVLLVAGIAAGCASTPAAAPQGGCCERETPQKSDDAERARLVSEGKAYYDKTGKYHDHATTAMVWTVCNCKVCDRKDKCCGPNHCICNPN